MRGIPMPYYALLLISVLTYLPKSKKPTLDKIKAEISSGNRCPERSYTCFDKQVNKYYVAEIIIPNQKIEGDIKKML
jgi:hypothetical protein